MFFKSEQGFSLLQVIVTASMIMLSGLAMLNLIENNLKTQKGIELTDELQNTMSVIRMSLSVGSVCQLNIANFKNPQRAFATEFDSAHLATEKLIVDKIQNTATHVIVTNNSELPGKPGTFLKIYLTNLVALNAGSSYVAELIFEFDKNRSNIAQTVLGVKNIVRRLPIGLKTTGVGGIQQITQCSVFSESLTADDIKFIKNEVCDSLNGIFDSVTGKCDIGPYYQL